MRKFHFHPARQCHLRLLPIGINVWLLPVPFALLLQTADEIRKYYVSWAGQ